MTQHTFGYSQSVVEEYGQIIENKIDFGQEISMDQAVDDIESDVEDIDFIGKKSLKEDIENLDRSIGELDSLNLFGVAVDKSAQDLAKDLSSKVQSDKARVRKILGELVSMAKELDPQGESKDFSTRKAFNYYDPYNLDGDLVDANLLYEDGTSKEHASLIVHLHDDQLSKISQDIEDSENVQDKQLADHILQMTKQLNYVKIVDPQVLLKLYHLYRYKVNDEKLQGEL